MSNYDPMLDYTITKIEDGVKALKKLHSCSFVAYKEYTQLLAKGIKNDIDDYIKYMQSLDK